MSVWGNPVRIGGGGGGGGGSAAAAVSVICLAETTVTATNGAVTLTGISDASGLYLFLLPTAGVWTFASGTKARQLSVSAGHVYTLGLRTLLIASAQQNILTESFAEDYASGSMSWGDFVLSGSPSKADGALVLPAGSRAVYSLAAQGTPVTVYALAKQNTAVSGDNGILSVPYADSDGCLPNFYSRSGVLRYSVYGWSDTDAGGYATDWRVLAFSVSPSLRVSFYADGTFVGAMQATRSGAFVGLASTATAANALNGSYKHAAVVSGAETDGVILANMQSIMDYYGLTE